jgi:hypothetical protein
MPTKYQLTDVEQANLRFPSLPIPPMEERYAIGKGQTVQLIFGLPAEVCSIGGERLWVEVTEVGWRLGKCKLLTGTLLDTPAHSELGVKVGDAVVFEPRHVIKIEESHAA